jgi:hypothetical protein
MFSDKKLDYEVNVIDFTYDPPKKVPYSIYSVDRVKEIAEKYDFSILEKSEFLIDIDLPDKHEGRGTYTIVNDQNNRMMFTGDLYLPWKFLIFKKEAKK